MPFLFVALGGAVGALGRYAISLIPLKPTFPLLTLFTNIGGAILIGFIVGLSDKHDVPDNLKVFIKVGVCGGFTTFSSFSLETYNLLKDGDFDIAILYSAISVVSCLVGVWIGRRLSLLVGK